MIEKSIKILTGVIVTVIMSSCGTTQAVDFSHPLDTELTQEDWYSEQADCENCDEID